MDIQRFQFGGMNRVLNPFAIKPTDVKLCLNYNSDIFFAKKKRTGYSLFLNNPDSSQVNNLIYFDRADAYRFVLRNSGTSLYKYAFSGTTWGSAVKTTFGGDNDQIQTIGDATATGSPNSILDASTDRLAQGFQVSTTGSYPSLWVLLELTQGSPGNIDLRIETDSAGSPSGILVTNGSATIAQTSVGTTISWVRVDFTNAPTLTASTQYHLVLGCAGASGTARYRWGGSVYDVYANGSAKNSTNSGTSYGALTGTSDLAFVLNLRKASRCGSAVLNNKLVLSNGVDPMCYTVNGTDFVNITETSGSVTAYPPPAPFLKVWKGRLYAAGSILAPSRLYYSKSYDPTSWVNDATLTATGGYLDIDPDSNGDIIGIDMEGGRLVVHKQDAAYRIIPDEYGRPNQIIQIGSPTTSHWSIARSEKFNVGYYFADEGLFEHNGDVPKLISTPIQDLIEGITASSKTDLAGYFFNYKYYCTMGSSITESERLGDRTFANPIAVYDIRLQELYLYTVADTPTCFNSWADTSNVDNMYMGDSAGNTYKWDTSTVDYDTPIHGELELYDDDADAPHINKTYDMIHIEMNPGCESNFFYKLEGEDWTAVGDVSKGKTVHYFGDDGKASREMTIKIDDSSTTAPSVFYGYVLSLTGDTVPPQQATSIT